MGLLGEWKKKAQGLLNPQTALDATRGLLMGATTDVLGYPVDVLSDAMRPFGYNVTPRDTVGSSDWLANKLTAPTGSGAETAGRFASGLLTPGPQELLQATGLLKKSAPVRELITYHGSPHRINNVDADNPMGKFDLSKVGTGEGAQAYGHGIYLAENPDVARSYMTAGGSGDWLTVTPKGGKPIYGDALGEKELAAIGLLERGAKDAGQFKHNTVYYAKKYTQDPEVLRLIDDWKDAKIGYQSHRSFYTVDLPDEHIAKMLDWDAPLFKQTKEVQDAVADLYYKRLVSIDPTEKTSLGQIYNELAQSLGSQKDASAYFQGKGIPGIKYFDGGSRAAGEGTRNFVIFSPEVAKILKRE